MTRVVKGIYDDVCLDRGFFLCNKEVDIVVDWLESYAKALENSWRKKGGEGNPSKQKFAKVRSFGAAIKRNREQGDKVFSIVKDDLEQEDNRSIQQSD